MSLKEKRIWMAAGFLVLLFAFYWYSLRPYSAKSDCLEKAEKFIKYPNNTQSFEDIYDSCMLRRGYKQ